MDKILFVALGSAFGGVGRFLISRWFPASVTFPWATFTVNVLGCFIIGLIYGLIDRGVGMSENARLFLTVGFCGGFTTFSTFVNENYILFEKGNMLMVCAYAALSFFVGLLLAYAGQSVARI